MEELERSALHPISDLISAIDDEGVGHAAGLEGGYAAATLATLCAHQRRRLLVVTPTMHSAREIANDLATFGLGRVGQEILVIPAPDVSPYGEITPDRNRVFERLNAQFRSTMSDDVAVVVLPIQGAMRKMIPWSAVEAATTVISTGETGVSLEHLRHLLTLGGYNTVRVVEDPGTYAVRGGILDIYCPYDAQPVRIDLFGDEVESIRRFDSQTQRTLETIESFVLVPAREEVITDTALERARRVIRARGDELGLPSAQVNDIVRELESGFSFFGITSLLPALFELQPALNDLLDEALTVVLSPRAVYDQAQEFWTRRQQEYERVLEEGELLAFAPDTFFQPPHLLFEALEGRTPRLELHTLAPPGIEPCLFRARDNSDVLRVRKSHSDTEPAVQGLVHLIERWREDYGRIAFACRSQGSADRLLSLLQAYGQDVDIVDGPIPLSPAAPPCSTLQIYTHTLSSGFRSVPLGQAIISDSTVFGPSARRSTQQVVEESLAISHFRELSAGDLVVHRDFGVARYHGIEMLDVMGVCSDYLKLEFSGNDKLYLPVYRLGRIQKYATGDGASGALDKLGGTRWEATTRKIRAELQALAVELLGIYAERQSRSGFNYPAPGALFREFEASFPFEETPHQGKAIEEVISDMTSTRPMDRLICGDVGFGKTEVAIRAALLAALGGKQTAVLVPTTILSDQHARTFHERLSEFPVRIESLNRFRTATERKAIIEATERGEVDILIGTHRILSKDIAFRDLGLMIIDEEQRFGVTHKEKLKSLKRTVDVLTMTATPIPRTLEMSLLGIRDLSIILTPPSDRLAVRTYIAHYGEAVIREAIESELRRGGQVFVVHNRVQGIHEIAQTIRDAVPQARVIVGHAQMSDAKLERVMSDFVNRKADVLVSTTIIESGLDIGSANTILINRADRFGLGQLYQLRGRVGRSRERAFCYLLVPRRRKLPRDAARRLEVIRTHTELGSGLSISQHDLDIRGAGNLLGADQSGHIKNIGYDLYCELLEEAIQEQRDGTTTRRIEPEVIIPITALIPVDYIADEGLRLLFYKRLSMARTEDDLDTVLYEIVDRFGRYPREVFNLRQIVSIKIALAELALEKVETGPTATVFTLSPACRLAPDRVVELVRREQGRFVLREDMRLIRKWSPSESEDLLGATRAALEKVKQCAHV